MPSKYRIGATLEPEIYQWIIDEAKRNGRTPSNLAAFLLTIAVTQQMERQSEQKDSKQAS